MTEAVAVAVPIQHPRERYISPTPGGGYLVRVTRAAKPAYAKTLEQARQKRSDIFLVLFGEPYTDEAADRFAYSSNKGSNRRGVEFVELISGKSFWQVKYKEFAGPDDITGHTRIKKFFVSRWGTKGGYDAALAFKDERIQLEAQHRSDYHQRKATQ